MASPELADNQIVTSREGTVGTEADGQVNAPAADTSVRDDILPVEGQSKVKIITKLFEPPSGWSFKEFLTKVLGQKSLWVDVIPGEVEGYPLEVPTAGAGAIRVNRVFDEDVTNAGGFPLQLEGNLEPPPGEGEPQDFYWAAKVCNITVSLGLVLPARDEPAPPATIAQVDGVTYTPLDSCPPCLPLADPKKYKLFIAANSYVPLLAKTELQEDNQFTWNPPANELFDQKGRGLGRVALAANAATTTVAGVEITVHPVTCSVPFTVAGYAGHTITFTVAGYTFAQGDTFSLGSNITVENISVNGSTITGTITTAAAATQGVRAVTFSVVDPKDNTKRKTVAVDDVFAVYKEGAAIDSLLVLLDRPASSANQPAYPGQKGGGRKIAAEETRIGNVVNATTRANVIAPWNTLSSTDVSLGARALPLVTDAQIEFLCDAAAQIQGNAVRSTVPVNEDYPNQPPAIPKSMWAAFLKFAVNREMGTAGVLAMAGVPDESSVGMLQFNNDTAYGRSTGTNKFEAGPIAIDVAIYCPGILGGADKTYWKDHIIAATTVAELRQRVADLAADWRSCPYRSAVNMIRKSEALYGRMIASKGVPAVEERKYYQPNEDFRADAGSGRQNGQGSQRDLFAALATAHQLPANVFGGGGVTGGYVTAPSPDEWHTEEHTPPYMNGDGRSYATAAENYYDNHVPQGGYQ